MTILSFKDKLSALAILTLRGCKGRIVLEICDKIREFVHWYNRDTVIARSNAEEDAVNVLASLGNIRES